MRILDICAHMLEVVIEVQSVGARCPERVGLRARVRVSRVERDGPQEIRQRQRRMVAGPVQLSLSSQDVRTIGRERLGAIERITRFPQPAPLPERVSKPDERLHVLRLHHENGAIHVGRMFRTTHPTVQARNPQARLDVVRIRRGEGLELLQRGCVRTGVGEPFRFRPLKHAPNAT